MAMNRDKFRNIVGGITTPEQKAEPVSPIVTAEPAPLPVNPPPVAAEVATAGQGASSAGHADLGDDTTGGERSRFAKRGRPKGSKQQGPAGTARKVKVSLFLSEVLVNDLYEWAHADRMHPGEMFELALKPFHERETKRRKGGKE